jgi:hypothetical protein
MEQIRDFKLEQKELYQPKTEPSMIDVPQMTFIAVDGIGDPNEPGGEYAAAMELLYALSFTIRMSEKSGYAIDGFFAYRVPPLEGFWEMADGRPGVDYGNKSGFAWTSVIRQPEFVDETVFQWAQQEVERKKRIDTSRAKLLLYREGLCVQCMHIGPYDDEPATIERLDGYAAQNGYRIDIGGGRRHHEIYLGDPRKTAPEKIKTVLRHPVAKA